MPLTSLCSFAVDGLADPEDCKRAIDKLWTFIWTDTACYRNSESSELREKQERILNPLLDWVDSKWGVRLVTTRLVEPLKHDSGEIDVFKQESIKGLSQYQLAALDALVKSTKSYVIPMAFLHGHITAEETYIASRIEEDLQVLKWGEVEGGHDLDQAYTKVKIYSASLLMQLLEDRD
jgi:ATP synthase F1 complex assembly factor 2